MSNFRTEVPAQAPTQVLTLDDARNLQRDARVQALLGAAARFRPWLGELLPSDLDAPLDGVSGDPLPDAAVMGPVAYLVPASSPMSIRPIEARWMLSAPLRQVGTMRVRSLSQAFEDLELREPQWLSGAPASRPGGMVGGILAEWRQSGPRVWVISPSGFRSVSEPLARHLGAWPLGMNGQVVTDVLCATFGLSRQEALKGQVLPAPPVPESWDFVHSMMSFAAERAASSGHLLS